MEYSFSTNIGGRPLSIRSGKIAKQASGAVLVQYGDTIVMASVVADHQESANRAFLPLSVEYQEKIYASGRIPGNYHRREIGRPSEKETLTSRLIDRPIRPLFPDGYFYETQIIATVLSMDRENEPDVLAMLGASAALEISDIPFAGPIAGVRVIRIDGQLKVNPTIEETSQADINIIVAGSKTGIIMVEGGGNFVSESEMLEAIYFGHEAMQPLLDIQNQLKEAMGKQKRSVEPPPADPELETAVQNFASPGIQNVVSIPTKMERNAAKRALKKDVLEHFATSHEGREEEIANTLSDLLKTTLRRNILDQGIRLDGRKADQVRPIQCEVDLLPRPHGSALFTRGETQVMGVLTLGSTQDEQRVETLSGDETRPFMLHYNFPPFSVGEVKRIGGPSRRDIGHGALATRAIEKVLPSHDHFDYTIRLIAEVTESNGSSSMGTVCAGILALMDGGVPIVTPVSGIAMGLIQEGDQIVILSDILGDEDHSGDMDFKVAGSRDGITALQMDIKIKELSRDILEKALDQARLGRIHILDKMMEAINVSRSEISEYAPKSYAVQINPDKIRDLIGPGGKNIRAIQTETLTRIEVDDSGMVKIYADNQENGEIAQKRVIDIGTDPEVGTVYDGVVVKTTDFGAFVNIKPGTDGLVHISELAHYRVKKVTDIVREGDPIKVKVLEVSKDGKIRLSHKATIDKKN